MKEGRFWYTVHITHMYSTVLEAFENWDNHVAVLQSCFGKDNSRINQALAIVETYHDQPRTIGVGNYNRHPLRVARIVLEEMHITDEQTILIALCHDLGEWSTYDVSQLATTFGADVAEGVKTLTWDQNGEWADFVATIVHAGIDNLVAIKIADKLDNNRAVALTGTKEDKMKALQKTNEVILPLVQDYYPGMLSAYREVLARLDDGRTSYR
jgi:(p)ppGpp synthase/HD superfamily hydrolase